MKDGRRKKGRGGEWFAFSKKSSERIRMQNNREERVRVREQVFVGGRA